MKSALMHAAWLRHLCVCLQADEGAAAADELAKEVEGKANVE
jgi:hypothetical protein